MTKLNLEQKKKILTFLNMIVVFGIIALLILTVGILKNTNEASLQLQKNQNSAAERTQSIITELENDNDVHLRYINCLIQAIAGNDDKPTLQGAVNACQIDAHLDNN